MSKKFGRLTSGPWGRLKPVDQESLDSMGLVSKGDDRLKDEVTQEKYFRKIMEKYMIFCVDAATGDELSRRFAALELAEGAGPLSAPTAAPLRGPSRAKTPTVKPDAEEQPEESPDKFGSKTKIAVAPKSKQFAVVSRSTERESTASSTSSETAPRPSSEKLADPENTRALSDILMALRKLREGIVASKRVDDFANQAYLFCVRLSILVRHPESYHPTILRLLQWLHPQNALESMTKEEIVGYLVLDTACRRKELTEAFILAKKYQLRSGKVYAVLHALVHDNWVRFRKLKGEVDGHKARIMEFAEDDMRITTLKAFARTYMSVRVDFLEAMTGKTWPEIQKDDECGWQREGDLIIIRKVKGKAPA